jgi:hypothetical protein
MTATLPESDGDAPPKQSLQDIPALGDHSPEQYRPLGGYLTLMGLFAGLVAAFGTWFRRSDRSLPEQPALGDLALISIAAYKTSRVIAKDRVTSAVRAPFTQFQDDAGSGEVNEAARGRGLQLALGELLICPYCLGLWTAAPLTAGFIVAPRATRWIASVLTAVAVADLMQIAYKNAEETI